MKWIAALFWVCTGLAIWSHYDGNPTAVNGVVGAGVCALVTTILAAIEE